MRLPARRGSTGPRSHHRGGWKIEDKGERIKAILEAAEDGLPSDEEQKVSRALRTQPGYHHRSHLTLSTTSQVRASFGDDDVDAFLEGAFVISSPKPLYPTAPDKASFAKTLRQVKDHKDALAAWLEEVDDDEVAADELASQYSKAQLAFALAGFLKKAEKALPGLTLSAGLERERLAELVVAVVGVEKAEEVDVEKLLGDDWAAIFSGYTAHLEDHRRRNEECRLRWEEADEKEEVFDELVARGWGSGPSSSAEGFWWKVAGRSAARFFPKDDIGGEAFKKRHE